MSELGCILEVYRAGRAAPYGSRVPSCGDRLPHGILGWVITLYGFGPTSNLPGLSPFVIKVATWCRLSGVEYASKIGDPRKAPKGKMPYIDDNGLRIADSSAILDYLRTKHRDLDAGLGASDRAVARAFQGMIEEHYYFTAMYLRWQEELGWTAFAPTLREKLVGSGVPDFATGLVANMVRSRVRKTLHAQGTGRHTPSEVEDSAIADLDAISAWLGDRPYFLGDRARNIDATVWAFLFLTRESPVENRVVAHLKGQGNLIAYLDRIHGAYWK